MLYCQLFSWALVCGAAKASAAPVEEQTNLKGEVQVFAINQRTIVGEAAGVLSATVQWTPGLWTSGARSARVPVGLARECRAAAAARRDSDHQEHGRRRGRRLPGRLAEGRRVHLEQQREPAAGVHRPQREPPLLSFVLVPDADRSIRCTCVCCGCAAEHVGDGRDDAARAEEGDGEHWAAAVCVGLAHHVEQPESGVPLILVAHMVDS